MIGDGFKANSGGEVNISGGAIGREFHANSGSEVNLSGGTVREFFRANPGSEVVISGGTVGTIFANEPGSRLELIGGEFRLNGAEHTDPTVSVTFRQDIFTGTLQDGSTFIFSIDSLTDVILTNVPLPAIDTTPMVVNTAVPNRPSGLRAGQTLTLQEGGALGDNFEVVDATLNVEGGVLGASAGVAGGVVNISGGHVGESFDAYAGSQVNISGGVIAHGLLAFDGSQINISGGTLDFPSTREGSEVNISGGSIGSPFSLDNDASLTLIGGEFRVDGVAFNGSSVSYLDGRVLSATLEDGSTFITPLNLGYNTRITLTQASLPTFDTTPIVVDTPLQNRPSGIRAGQTLTLRDGGELTNFYIVDGTLNVEGGNATGTTAVEGGVVNVVSGGNLSHGLEAYTGSEVNVTGGAITSLVLHVDSTARVSGGAVDRVTAHHGSVINISGGAINEEFDVRANSEVNLFGTEFFINGVAIDELVVGEAFLLTDRDVLLSGKLADGSSFLYDLQTDSSNFNAFSFFDPDATLTLTLVPEPTAWMLLAIGGPLLRLRRRAA